jgi:hypothetical protein
VIAYARQHLKSHPREVGPDNSGPWVRLYMDRRDGPAWPWCAGFSCFILKQAAETLDVAMPIQSSFDVDALASSAKANDRFIEGSKAQNRSRVKPGSLFLSQKRGRLEPRGDRSSRRAAPHAPASRATRTTKAASRASRSAPAPATGRARTSSASRARRSDSLTSYGRRSTRRPSCLGEESERRGGCRGTGPWGKSPSAGEDSDVRRARALRPLPQALPGTPRAPVLAGVVRSTASVGFRARLPCVARDERGPVRRVPCAPATLGLTG